MRVIVFLLVLTVAGCSSQSGMSGKSAKNGQVMQYERLGTLTSYEMPTEMKCGRRQVQFCAPDSQGQNCTCVHRDIAKDRIRRMADQLNNRYQR